MSAKVNLNLPKSLWSARDSQQLAFNTVAVIKIRTGKGLDADETPFKDYSTTPLYVAKKGARLTPKGGRPSRTGKSIYYAKGYKQYKDESRRRGGAGDSAEVDLVLSGNMLNNFVVKEATDDGFVLGLTKHAQYGYYVNEDREFIGVSDREVDILAKAVEIDIRRKLK
jgi:hypothetical protein|tara:strand:+ start:90 stop:593 length:504 start_codon:yes stop_codon:yes gene_type:complete